MEQGTLQGDYTGNQPITNATANNINDINSTMPEPIKPKPGLKRAWDHLLYGNPFHSYEQKIQNQNMKNWENQNQYRIEKDAMERAGLNPYAMFAGGGPAGINKKDEEKDDDGKLMQTLMMLLGMALTKGIGAKTANKATQTISTKAGKTTTSTTRRIK